MNLPIEAITQFQEIYQRRLGIALTIGEAGIRAKNFLKLMMLVIEKPKVEAKNTNLYKK